MLRGVDNNENGLSDRHDRDEASGLGDSSDVDGVATTGERVGSRRRERGRKADVWLAVAKVVAPLAWITLEVLRWFDPH